MYTVRKTYRVEYAHQLESAFTKCCHETIHGHSGVIELFFTSHSLNDDEMVVDFGKIGKIVKKYLMDSFDHALYIPASFDKAYIRCLKIYNKKLIITETNPTAEYFCRRIYENVYGLMSLASRKNEFSLLRVRFHETDSGYAEFEP
jgi:6-pyruvoyltetrahydropterin/6-carboxytetrahydropterin synthase